MPIVKNHLKNWHKVYYQEEDLVKENCNQSEIFNEFLETLTEEQIFEFKKKYLIMQHENKCKRAKIEIKMVKSLNLNWNLIWFLFPWIF